MATVITRQYWFKVLFEIISLIYFLPHQQYYSITLLTCNIMLEYADDEFMANKDKWFVFTEDEEKVIEEYIATR